MRRFSKRNNNEESSFNPASVKKTESSRRNRDRIFGLTESPTYYPTKEEFKDPLKYIDKIRPEAEKYGAVKIVPPKDYKPKFCLNTKDFRFKAQIQKLSNMEGESRSIVNYLEQLYKYHKTTSKQPIKIPQLDKRPIDLFRLKTEVTERGGVQLVTKQKKWAEIGRIMGYARKQCTSMSNALKSAYLKIVLPYEIWHSKHKEDLDATMSDIDSTVNAESDKCEVCHSNDNEDALLLCDGCNRGYHLYCLKPPLKNVPKSDWFCSECLTAVKKEENDYQGGQEYTLGDFQKKCDKFKSEWFASNKPTEEECENEFWRLADNPNVNCQVEHGSDLHSTQHGSGFMVAEQLPKDNADPWNLNTIPITPKSLFTYVKKDVNSMTAPWLHIGMCFSASSWHCENHFAYSLSYMHWGETRTWYAIPGTDANKFEDMMKKAVPEVFEQQPDLLSQLVTFISPERLKKENLQVYAVDQRPGQFVVTFPKVYHSGFNHGFNFCETVNFLPGEWVDYGNECIKRYKEHRHPPCFSHDEMLVTALQNMSPDEQQQHQDWLKKAVLEMQTREMKERKAIRKQMIKEKYIPETSNTDDDDDNNDNDEITASTSSTIVEQQQQQQPLKEQQQQQQKQPLQKKEKDEKKEEEDDDDDEEEDEKENGNGNQVQKQPHQLQKHLQCVFCNCYTYLSYISCVCTEKVSCLDHMLELCTCPKESRTLCLRFTDKELNELTPETRVTKATTDPKGWKEKMSQIWSREQMPTLDQLQDLLKQGEKEQDPDNEDELKCLQSYVDHLSQWTKKVEKLLHGSSTGNSKNNNSNNNSNSNSSSNYKQNTSKTLLIEAEEIGLDKGSYPLWTELKTYHDELQSFDQKVKEALESSNFNLQQQLYELGCQLRSDSEDFQVLAETVKGRDWELQVKDALKKPFNARQIKRLIKKGKELGINGVWPDYLVQIEQSGKKWMTKIDQICKGKIKVNLEEEQELLSAGKNKENPNLTITIDPDLMNRLEQNIKKSKETLKEIEQVLMYDCKRPTVLDRPSITDAQRLVTAGREMIFNSDTVKLLSHEVSRVSFWNVKARSIFVQSKQITKPLESIVKDALINVQDITINQDKVELWCLCRKPEAGLMVECDVCHEWYHNSCVKVPAKVVAEESSLAYICPVCSGENEHVQHFTKKPRLDQVTDVIEKANSLLFCPKEFGALDAIQQIMLEYKTRVQAFCRSRPQLTLEDVPMIRKYLRSLEGLEIALPDETDFLKKKLRALAPVTHLSNNTIQVGNHTGAAITTSSHSMDYHNNSNSTAPSTSSNSGHNSNNNNNNSSLKRGHDDVEEKEDEEELETNKVHYLLPPPLPPLPVTPLAPSVSLAPILPPVFQQQQQHENNSLVCVCHNLVSENSNSVECSHCQNKFHSTCIGPLHEDKYKCPRCSNDIVTSRLSGNKRIHEETPSTTTATATNATTSIRPPQKVIKLTVKPPQPTPSSSATTTTLKRKTPIDDKSPKKQKLTEDAFQRSERV